MADETEVPEPFKSILHSTFPPTAESMRICCLGTWVSAGGGGVLMMMKNWEVLNHRNIPAAEKLGFLGDVAIAREQLSSLTSDVSKADAAWIAMLCRHSRVYWVDDLTEVSL